jgi:hypothetical protein
VDGPALYIYISGELLCQVMMGVESGFRDRWSFLNRAGIPLIVECDRTRQACAFSINTIPLVIGTDLHNL